MINKLLQEYLEICKVHGGLEGFLIDKLIRSHKGPCVPWDPLSPQGTVYEVYEVHKFYKVHNYGQQGPHICCMCFQLEAVKSHKSILVPRVLLALELEGAPK